MLLLIDNYDSFTYNLVQYLGELGEEVVVRRNDEITLEGVEKLKPERIVVSPGPCTPNEAGISVPLIEQLSGSVPILGVCLGHQSLAAAFGGSVVRGEPVHGKTAPVDHDGRTIFEGIESPFLAGRYHSLVVHPDLPHELEPAATSGDTLMAIRHRSLPAEGLQFHPESVLTGEGISILRNFLEH